MPQKGGVPRSVLPAEWLRAKNGMTRNLWRRVRLPAMYYTYSGARGNGRVEWERNRTSYTVKVAFSYRQGVLAGRRHRWCWKVRLVDLFLRASTALPFRRGKYGFHSNETGSRNMPILNK